MPPKKSKFPSPFSPNFSVTKNVEQGTLSRQETLSMPPKFVCSKCGLFDFPRLDALHSHIVLVHFSNHHATYECLMSSCPARFLTELCMLTHVMEVHKARNLDSQVQKEIPIRTDIYQRLDESINMSFAQSLPPTFMCSICCESGFPRLDALHSHIVLEHYNGPRATYECLNSSCPVLFATEFCMLRHVRKTHQPGNPKSPVEMKISLRLLIYQCLNKSVNLSFEKCSEQVSSTRLSQCCVFPLTGSDLTADPPEANGTSKSFEPSNDLAIKSEPGMDLGSKTSNTDSPKETVIKEEPIWLEEMANELELPGPSFESTAHPSIPINSRQPDVSVAKTMDKELIQLQTSSSWPDVKDELDDYFMSPNTSDWDVTNFAGSSNSIFPSSHPCANNASDAPTFEPSIASTVKSEPGVDLGSKTSNTDSSKEPVIKDEPSLLEEMANELELPGPSFAGSSNSTFPSSLPLFHSFSTDSSNVRTWNVNSVPDSTTFTQTAIMGERIVGNLRQDINSKFVSSSQDDIRYLLTTPNNDQNRKRVERKKRQLVINYSGTGNSASRTIIYHSNRKRRNFLTSEERQMIIDYSEGGHSTTEIGALLKRNPRFVRKVLTEHRKPKSEEKSNF
ncbi:hypothetical protein Ddc_13754 [Ditylenchus destructor]|nr:hypothetical protein Ddc_13754 [Ditylenchus destructor]